MSEICSGSRTSFFYLSLLVVGQLILSSFAIGFAEYADALIPGIDLAIAAASNHDSMFCR